MGRTISSLISFVPWKKVNLDMYPSSTVRIRTTTTGPNSPEQPIAFRVNLTTVLGSRLVKVKDLHDGSSVLFCASS